MKNLIAELLIKLAERDEEYKLQTERLAAMEVILSAMLDSLPPESLDRIETKLHKKIADNSDSAHGIRHDDAYSRLIAEISAINHP
ncbi:sigma-S stabilization anti-adapter protein IraP [Tatumella citrea]|uniref:Anti-adapter protein IraP n=1 Tax=Tatumella citrea TaxID=53336 RepID=A0A1Y0LGN8_TATCI|nr:sigma-S stabilization anti-adapter protein IraP [Tatumella citrea]ARU93212.1 hypothetical protein A7K98_05050 [Tatumella citrea]ARU97251.1 hypothetical protein A7K99_05050 [Tatumella citrea]